MEMDLKRRFAFSQTWHQCHLIPPDLLATQLQWLFLRRFHPVPLGSLLPGGGQDPVVGSLAPSIPDGRLKAEPSLESDQE